MRSDNEPIIIRPGQHVVTVNSPGSRAHLNKASLHLALFGGFSSDATHYLITGPIKNRPTITEKPELRGAKDNEIELDPGVYLEVDE